MKKISLLLLVATMVIFWGCRKTPQACFTASETVVAPGETIEFSNCTEDGDSYVWDMGDGTELTGTDVEHSYDEPGTYLVELHAFSSNERFIGTTSKLIEVIDPMAPRYISTIRITSIPEQNDGQDWDTPTAGVCPDGCPWPDVFVRITIPNTGWTFNTNFVRDVNLSDADSDLPISWDLAHLSIKLDDRDWFFQMRNSNDPVPGSELMKEFSVKPFSAGSDGMIVLEDGEFRMEVHYEN